MLRQGLVISRVHFCQESLYFVIVTNDKISARSGSNLNSTVTHAVRAKTRFPWSRWLVLIIVALIAILYVTNGSKPGTRVEGCGEGCAIGAAQFAGRLRVVSLNMLHGFPLFKDLSKRIDLISKELQRLDADVVLLQEVPWTIQTGNVAKLLGTRLGYNYLYYRADGNKSLILFEQGEAILSRFPLIDARSTAYQPRASYFDSRVALGATVLTPSGSIDVYVTHLTNENLVVANQQAELLRSFVTTNSKGVTLVAGDFNSPENSPQIMALSQVWIDTFRWLHPYNPGYTCCIDDLNSNVAKPLDERIDYIFLIQQDGGSWQLVEADIVFDSAFLVDNRWQWASDHEGLLVELQFGQTHLSGQK